MSDEYTVELIPLSVETQPQLSLLRWSKSPDYDSGRSKNLVLVVPVTTIHCEMQIIQLLTYWRNTKWLD